LVVVVVVVVIVGAAAAAADSRPISGQSLYIFAGGYHAGKVHSILRTTLAGMSSSTTTATAAATTA